MTTIPVTERAVIQRVNRKLADNDEVLKTARGSRALSDLGRFYIINARRNSLSRQDVDLEALARELGVLRAYEALVE